MTFEKLFWVGVVGVAAYSVLSQGRASAQVTPDPAGPGSPDPPAVDAGVRWWFIDPSQIELDK